MAFLGSFSGTRSFGRGVAGGNLTAYFTANSFSLVSGTAGSPTAVYERVYSGGSSSYTLPAPPIPAVAQILVIGGGGGAAGGLSGGGGGGGVVYHPSFAISSAISVYVGSGGSGTSSHGAFPSNGENTTFGSITANGGGAGGRWSEYPGNSGGNGGGCNGHWGGYYSGGPSNQSSYPGATIYGTRGGNKNECFTYVGGGGGGAGGNGDAYGGNGTTVLGRSIAGGGGGGSHYGWGYYPPSYARGGGGGRGTIWHHAPGDSGTDGTGGGGGSGHHSPENSGGRGGHGLVVVRMRGDGLQI